MSLIKKTTIALGSYLHDCTDKILISHRKNTEMRKIKDSRREQIRSNVTLSHNQKNEIDDFFLFSYGEKVPYFWHEYYTAYTGRFDVKYFPELLYIPEFEYYMNLRHSYQKVYADKNVIPMIAHSVGVKTPQVFLSAAAGVFRNQEGSIVSKAEALDGISNMGECFIKPATDSSSGNGCAILNICNGVDTVSGNSLSLIIDKMGADFIIQERVKCHSSIARLYADSVNTFRIMTYRWNDKIEHAPIILRIGQGGGNLDNAHAGGMFIAVEDDGSFHEKSFTEFRNEYRKHPDTNVVFSGYRIPLVSNVILAARKLHETIPQIGVINWDLTIDTDGSPLLIEANTFGGSIWLFQMAHGKGVFGDKTTEILQWIREQKKLKYSQRNCCNNFR